jgi:hypothetical protein
MIIRKYLALIGAIMFATAMGYATPASAQASRTWVSGVGDDVNPCSRTAPCKTFAGAISKTAAGGEINCLDPGGFGAVTIIKSMTIDCHYTEGGALAGGNGVVVNLPAVTDVVFLRGLDIFGVNPPSNGVRFIAQGTLHIEDSVIRRFNAASSQGVSFQPTGSSKLFISNTIISDNGNGVTGGGILIKPTGSGSARVELLNVRVNNNANIGLSVDTTGNTGFVAFNVADSHFIGTTGSGVSVLAGAEINGMITDSTIAHNTASGLVGNGALVTVRVGNTSIIGNASVSGAGVSVLNAAQVRTYGDNRLDGNFADGAFTAVIIPKK